MTGSILIVDDDPSLVHYLSRYFGRRNLEVHRAATGWDAVELYDVHRPDVVLLDLELPDMSGLSVLTEIYERGATVVMLTGHGDIPTAVQAIKIGAENFLTKPVDDAHLDAVVERALEKARLKRTQEYHDRIASDPSLEPLGQSPRMRALAGEIERLAQADRTTLLLLGESGTGKGWVAERIHRMSPRSAGPFVEINSATLTGTLLESELFGHEKGAFTDARSTKRGLYEIADGGTLLLDEIADLDIALQPKLLKVIESRTFRRVGGTREISVDVRLIAATNRDLRRAVEQNQFREDLYYRLNVAPIELPPLRERSRQDLLTLTRAIFARLRNEMPVGPLQISAEALDLVLRHTWGGNIRELRNVLERARIVAGRVDVVEPRHLPADLREPSMPARSDGPLQSMQEVELEHIKRVLLHCEGNRTGAAKILGISRATLHTKIKKYGLVSSVVQSG